MLGLSHAALCSSLLAGENACKSGDCFVPRNAQHIVLCGDIESATMDRLL